MSVSDDAPEGAMKYGMLGEDNASVQEKLTKFQGEVDWAYLKPHFERGCLFFVDPSQEMTEVGEAMARDDKEAVQGWLKAGDLIKIEAIHAFQWEEGKALFEAVVISPFVLCRPL